MKTRELRPPREFAVGLERDVVLRHCLDLELEPDELVSFVSASGTQHDVTRKEWGYYATQSLEARLPTSGLRPALVRNRDGRTYLLLVEPDREAAFRDYLKRERLRVVQWLDADKHAASSCPMCGSDSLAVRFHYAAPPPGETRFPSLEGLGYERDVLQCSTCGHMPARTPQLPAELYQAEYVDATYGRARLRETFERIQALPAERSDNRQRVARVLAAYAERGLGPGSSVLDVGSGLCVFLACMKEAGWRGTALDPDPDAAAHAREHVGVDAHCGRLDAASGLGRFDLIAFNKVLEHVPDPHGLLSAAKRHLAPGGFVYVELPDAEAAADLGAEREEFFIEHLGVYSAASTALLFHRAGLRLQRLERLIEPSTKRTLVAFGDVQE